MALDEEGFVKGYDYVCGWGPNKQKHVFHGPHAEETVNPKYWGVIDAPGKPNNGLHSYKGAPVSDAVCPEHSARLMQARRQYRGYTHTPASGLPNRVAKGY